MKKLRLLILIALFILTVPSAWAQVFIEQGKVNVTIKPGEVSTGEIVINNTSNKEMKVKIYWEDFLYQAPFDGNKKFMPAGTSKTSLAQWVQFSPREAILPPFAKKKILYTIQTPADVHGGYYGVLFVEPDGADVRIEKGVKIVTRVGCLFFAETEDSIKKASVGDSQFVGGALNGKFYNKGNVVLLSQTTYYVMDRESVVADRGELKQYYLPPSGVADFSVPMASGLSVGDYTVVLTFDLGNGDVVVQEIDFTKNSDSDYHINAVRD